MIHFRTSPILFHVAAWVLFLTLPLLFMNEGESLTGITFMDFIANLIFCGFYISIFYINAYWLIPEYLLKKKYLIYATMLLLLLMLVAVAKPFDALMNHARVNGRIPEHRIAPPPPEGFGRPPGKQVDIISLFMFLLIIGISTALQSMKQWSLYEKRAIIAEADKANYELSFLKAQINPHFLYNTLNNIYTLIITENENAAACVMKLSSIMRYITDEAEADFVPLEHELDCLRNFIDLQKLRLGRTVSLLYSVTGDPKGHQITPLILMAFIENAFKYGISNHQPAAIDIKIDIQDQLITFNASNVILSRSKENGRTGVGISNTKKRLEFLYPNRHQLDIRLEEGYFKVNLMLMTTRYI